MPRKLSTGKADPNRDALTWIFATWPDAAGAARRVGLTRFQFRGLARKGVFRYRDCPTTGRRLYDPTWLHEWRLKNPTKVSLLRGNNTHAVRKAIAGEASAKAFRMFDAGAPLRDVVTGCSLNPDQVYELREHYVSMGSDVVLSHEAVKELRQVLPTWNGKTEDGLAAALTARIREAYEQGRQSHVGSSREGKTDGATTSPDAGSLASDLQGGTDPPDRPGDRGIEKIRSIGRGRSDLVRSAHGGTAPRAGAAPARKRADGAAGDERGNAGPATGAELDPAELAQLGQ